jgi:hypothetical protein
VTLDLSQYSRKVTADPPASRFTTSVIQSWDHEDRLRSSRELHLHVDQDDSSKNTIEKLLQMLHKSNKLQLIRFTPDSQLEPAQFDELWRLFVFCESITKAALPEKVYTEDQWRRIFPDAEWPIGAVQCRTKSRQLIVPDGRNYFPDVPMLTEVN